MSLLFRISLAAVAALSVGWVTPASAPAAAAGHFRVSASVRPSTVLVGRRVSVAGRVTPQAPQQVVKVQVSLDGGWHTVAVATLGAHSRYAATYLPPGAGTYQLRVRKPAASGERRGASAVVTLTVTPSLPPT